MVNAVGVRKRGDETPVTLADKYHLGSCTKSFTATLAATLVEEGKLGLTVRGDDATEARFDEFVAALPGNRPLFIRRGHADVMVVGSTGTRIHPLRSLHIVLQEQVAVGDDPLTLSRPFDLQRSGQVLGEGAGALIDEKRQAVSMGEAGQ